MNDKNFYDKINNNIYNNSENKDKIIKTLSYTMKLISIYYYKGNLNNNYFKLYLNLRNSRKSFNLLRSFFEYNNLSKSVVEYLNLNQKLNSEKILNILYNLSKFLFFIFDNLDLLYSIKLNNIFKYNLFNNIASYFNLFMISYKFYLILIKFYKIICSQNKKNLLESIKISYEKQKNELISVFIELTGIFAEFLTTINGSHLFRYLFNNYQFNTILMCLSSIYSSLIYLYNSFIKL